MGRGPRVDPEGGFQHAWNRGVGRRTLFERPADQRYFLSRVARQVRAGRIQVHAYTLSLNHFHLLVCSPKGELSKAMHWIQNQYSRWFNRRRHRDGPLYRNRYGAKLVVSGVHWETLLWYIDRHPLKEGLAADPRD